MTKITVDKALIEQAVEALQNHQGNYKLSKAECKKQEAVEDALRAALAEPAVEPLTAEKIEARIGYRLPPHSMKALLELFTSPPPPAEVPQLTPSEVAQMWVAESFDTMSHESCYVRGVKRGEQAVRQKAGLK